MMNEKMINVENFRIIPSNDRQRKEIVNYAYYKMEDDVKIDVSTCSQYLPFQCRGIPQQ